MELTVSDIWDRGCSVVLWMMDLTTLSSLIFSLKQQWWWWGWWGWSLRPQGGSTSSSSAASVGRKHSVCRWSSSIRQYPIYQTLHAVSHQKAFCGLWTNSKQPNVRLLHALKICKKINKSWMWTQKQKETGISTRSWIGGFKVTMTTDQMWDWLNWLTIKNSPAVACTFPPSKSCTVITVMALLHIILTCVMVHDGEEGAMRQCNVNHPNKIFSSFPELIYAAHAVLSINQLVSC